MMFAVAWVFLVGAIGSLAYGLSQEGLTFIWISIGASVVAMLFMLAGLLRRPVRPATAGAPYGPPEEEARREPAAAAATRAPTTRTREERPARKAASTRPTSKAAATRPSAAEEAPAEAPAAETAAEEAPAAEAPAKRTTARKPTAKKAAATTTTGRKSTAATSDRAQVLALPERGTYHLSACRIVRGRRDTERITRGTAKRRGYTACGICKPSA